MAFPTADLTSCKKKMITENLCQCLVLIKNKDSLNTIDLQCLFDHIASLLLKKRPYYVTDLPAYVFRMNHDPHPFPSDL